MKIRHSSMATAALLGLFTTAALAAGSALPGDNGRPGDGVPMANPPPRPAGPPPTHAPAARAPAIDLAVEAAQSIAQGCHQYKLGVTVVNSVGEPILIYLPDGSESSHGYMALRKAYTAITFKMPTSEVRSKLAQDPQLVDRIKADPNLVGYSGGLLLKVGDEIIGAIGVSGAEPGAHDAECGSIGVAKIKDRLK